MSHSNRTYACVVCGALRRAPLPYRDTQQIDGCERSSMAQSNIDTKWMAPIPYGHWRRCHFLPEDFPLPAWLMHCGQPMFLLGKRAAQAATQISAEQRCAWLKLGARVSAHAGGKRWRPILSVVKLRDAYPLV